VGARQLARRSLGCNPAVREQHYPRRERAGIVALLGAVFGPVGLLIALFFEDKTK
jgi:hypothetical protein